MWDSIPEKTGAILRGTIEDIDLDGNGRGTEAASRKWPVLRKRSRVRAIL